MVVEVLSFLSSICVVCCVLLLLSVHLTNVNRSNEIIAVHFFFTCIFPPSILFTCDSNHFETKHNVNHSEKDPKHTKRLKRTLFNWTKQDKRCTFSRKSTFQATYKIKTEERKKNPINSTYLLSVGSPWTPFSLSRRSISCPFPSASLRASN